MVTKVSMKSRSQSSYDRRPTPSPTLSPKQARFTQQSIFYDVEQSYEEAKKQQKDFYMQ